MLNGKRTLVRKSENHLTIGNIITIAVIVTGFIVSNAIARNRLDTVESRLNTMELIYERKDTHMLEIADIINRLVRIEASVDKISDRGFSKK